MSMCYPSTTDWSSAYTEQELTAMRADAVKLKQMKLAEARGWYVLAALTAWRVGVCPVLVRPVAACCAPAGSWLAAPVGGGNSHTSALPIRTIGGLNMTPYVTGGEWVNGCGCGVGVCSHTSMREIYLPGPVGDIEWVKLNGEIIDKTKYRVDNGNRLVSLDPDLVWPAMQDMFVGPDAIGAFAISYYQGAAPDELITSAAGHLAIEFYKGATKDSSCRLPRRVEEVSRRGTTYKVDQGLFSDGLTRIPEVDAVILILNPNKQKQKSRIVVPGNPGPRRQTWGRY